jgi:hypothetical protein
MVQLARSTRSNGSDLTYSGTGRELSGLVAMAPVIGETLAASLNVVNEKTPFKLTGLKQPIS